VDAGVHGAELFLRKIPYSFTVLLREQKGVTNSDGILVEDRKKLVVFIDSLGLGGSVNYVAENTIQNGASPFDSSLLLNVIQQLSTLMLSLDLFDLWVWKSVKSKRIGVSSEKRSRTSGIDH